MYRKRSNVPQTDEAQIAVEEKLRQLSKEGDIIPAKRNITCVALPRIEETLDWSSVYEEIRAERL